MSIEHPCFVSYPHPQTEGSFLDIFVQDLIAEINERLDGFLSGQVYWDKRRLKPTYNYDEALASAICQSTCLLVVYCPEYWRREYCRREFDLMDRINVRRHRELGEAAGKHNFVALVSLVHNNRLPQALKDKSWHVADFSPYMRVPNVGPRRIKATKVLREEVQNLVTAIQELHDLIGGKERFGSRDLCCGESLRSANSIPEWQEIPFPR